MVDIGHHPNSIRNRVVQRICRRCWQPNRLDRNSPQRSRSLDNPFWSRLLSPCMLVDRLDHRPNILCHIRTALDICVGVSTWLERRCCYTTRQTRTKHCTNTRNRHPYRSCMHQTSTQRAICAQRLDPISWYMVWMDCRSLCRRSRRTPLWPTLFCANGLSMDLIHRWLDCRGQRMMLPISMIRRTLELSRRCRWFFCNSKKFFFLLSIVNDFMHFKIKAAATKKI